MLLFFLMKDRPFREQSAGLLLSPTRSAVGHHRVMYIRNGPSVVFLSRPPWSSNRDSLLLLMCQDRRIIPGAERRPTFSKKRGAKPDHPLIVRKIGVAKVYNRIVLDRYRANKK